MNEQLTLENQLCFRFYKLHKNITKLYTPLLKELELTYPQYLVMLVLWQATKPVTVKYLGEALALDSGTLSPLLKRMEKQALIKRQRSATDERSVLIALTAHGKNIKGQAKLIPSKLLSYTGMAPVELSQLKHFLDVLLKNTDQHITA